jgi:hypothetical protein
MLEIYQTKKVPALPSFYIDELEKEAREKLKDRKSEWDLLASLLLSRSARQMHSFTSLAAPATAPQNIGTAASSKGGALFPACYGMQPSEISRCALTLCCPPLAL